MRHGKTQKHVKRQKRNCLLNQNKIWYGEAGYAISKLCTSKVTKNVLVDVTWDAAVHQVKPAMNEN